MPPQEIFGNNYNGGIIMDITYKILKEYETEILPLLEENPSIESFVQTVLDMSNIKYTFTLLNNMDQEHKELIHQQVAERLSDEDLQIIEECLAEC